MVEIFRERGRERMDEIGGAWRGGPDKFPPFAGGGDRPLKNFERSQNSREFCVYCMS
jgi:hypothetical protein